MFAANYAKEAWKIADRVGVPWGRFVSLENRHWEYLKGRDSSGLKANRTQVTFICLLFGGPGLFLLLQAPVRLTGQLQC